MTAAAYSHLLYTLLATGLALMAIGAVCIWVGKRQQKKREAWLRRWNIIELRSHTRASRSV